jgi:hypothetical protein
MKTVLHFVSTFKKSITLMAILMIGFSVSSLGTIYYISVTGNDATGNGTSANPWRTLNKATTIITGPGNIIYVNAGTFVETTTCYLAPGVSIEGAGVTSIIRSTLTAQWVPIIALSSSEGVNGNQHISNIKLDGNNLTTSWAVSITGRSNVSIYSCTITNFMESGVMWSGRNDFGPTPPSTYATGNSFHDNTITNCATADAVYGRGAFQFGGQDGMLVYNNIMIETGRAVGTQGWPIKNCNEGYTKNCKIYNNTIKRAPFPYAFNGQNNYWNFAIELFNEQGIEIYGNTIEGAIDMNHQTAGTSVYSLYIHDNTIGQANPASTWESGIILEYETNDAIIEKNTIKNCMDPLEFSLRTGSTLNNVRVNNNLCYNIGISDGTKQGFALRMMSGDNIYSANNFQVLNNTFSSITGPNAPFYGIQLPSGSGSSKIKVINNIVQNFDYYVITMNNAASVSNIEIKSNILYNNANNNGINFSSGTPSAYLNSGNLYSSPMFISVLNYGLQAVSPGINSGIDVGLPYGGTAPDRGYIENQALLPVKLVDLTVSERGEQNILEWKTAIEINSDHFSIERSNNGTDFTGIGNITAAGYSSLEKKYSFADALPLYGYNYYRLAMVDKNGSKEYSNIVYIKQGVDKTLDIATARIAASKNEMAVTVAAKENCKAIMTVIENSGRILLNKQVVLQKGMNFLSSDISPAAQSVYYVRLQTATESVVKNIMSNN